MMFDELSLLVLITTHEPFVLFSLCCAVAEGSDRGALVGAWNPTRVNLLHYQNKFMHRYRTLTTKMQLMYQGSKSQSCLLILKICKWYRGVKWVENLIENLSCTQPSKDKLFDSKDTGPSNQGRTRSKPTGTWRKCVSLQEADQPFPCKKPPPVCTHRASQIVDQRLLCTTALLFPLQHRLKADLK